MRYYLKFPITINSDLINSAYILGDVSFDTFWADDGYHRLQWLCNDPNPLAAATLELISIIDDKNKSYTIDQFLDLISTLKIRTR